MLPILFHIGSVPISTLGVFLVISFLYAIFLVWRLSRAWDFDEEKTLDIMFLTCGGAVLGSRIYFVLQNFQLFTEDITRVVSIFQYPGFSFWGAFLGGWLTLNYVVKKFKMDFWQVADIAAVAFVGSMVFGNIGCFLSGCGYGVMTDGFWGVSTVGQVGKRLPIQLIEALAMYILLRNLWPKAINFHTPGQILSLALVNVGLIKFGTEVFREQRQGGFVFAGILVMLGIYIFYRISRRSFRKDLKLLPLILKKMIVDPKVRRIVLQFIWRSCYNLTIGFVKGIFSGLIWRSKNFNKTLRRYNVKSTPKNY